MTTGIRALDTSLSKTKQWISGLGEKMHFDSDEQGFAALRAVLHVVRDRLTVDEATDLGSQLPMILRGVFYELYHPADKPLKIRSRQEFLDEVAKGLATNNDPKLRDPERITLGVFKILSDKVSDGEVKDVRESMPKPVQELWSQATARD